MNRQSLLFIAGFALAGAGLYALIVSLVGLNVSYLVWLAAYGRLAVFVAQLVMIMAGATLIVLGATDWGRERLLIERHLAERRRRPSDPCSN